MVLRKASSEKPRSEPCPDQPRHGRGHWFDPSSGARRHGGVYSSYTPWYLEDMSIPVTARLDESVVEALDRAVGAGLAPNRGAVVARAVAEWLNRHGEDAIVESYRRRYAEPDPAHDELIEQIASFSVAACLADSER